MQEKQRLQLRQINEQIRGDEKSLAVLEQKGRFVRFEKNERKYADELGFFRVLGGRVRVFSVAENGKAGLVVARKTMSVRGVRRR